MGYPLNENNQFNEICLQRLETLLPAGTQLLLDPDSEFMDWVKLTIIDLVYKQVLVIEKEYRTSHSRDGKIREYTIIKPGANFRKYPGLPYEQIFLKCWNDRKQYQLRAFVKEMYMSVNWFYKYARRILKSNKIHQLYGRFGLWSRMFGLELNATGQAVQKELRRYFGTIDNCIVQLVNDDPKRAVGVLSFLKGNMFLLENLTPELLSELIGKTKSIESDFLSKGLNISEMLKNMEMLLDNIDDLFYFAAYEGPGPAFYDTFLDYD